MRRLAQQTAALGSHGHFWCPDCDRNHTVRLNGPYKWEWNGSEECPTLQPSVKVTGNEQISDEQWAEYERYGTPLPVPKPFVCHSYVTNGQIQFLPDSTHELAGKTVDLPEYPEDYLKVPS